MFCKEPLGSNEVVVRPFRSAERLGLIDLDEVFSRHLDPVGRRLAFDPAKGRLWVVCRSCERWNLTPLEERW